MKIYLLDGRSMSVISEVLTIHVSSICNSETIPVVSISVRNNHHHQHSSHDHLENFQIIKSSVNSPSPFYQMKSLLSLSKAHGIVLAYDSDVNFQVGSWSISFWIRLLETADGKFTTLFFKGLFLFFSFLFFFLHLFLFSPPFMHFFLLL